MAGQAWTPQHEQCLRECMAGAPSAAAGYHAAAQRLGRSYSSCRLKWETLRPDRGEASRDHLTEQEVREIIVGKPQKATNKQPLKFVHDPERDKRVFVSDEMDPEDAVNEAEDWSRWAAENDKQFRRSLQRQRLRVRSENELAMMFFGDWHIERGYSSLDEIDKDIETVETTPNMVAVGCGDYFSNHIKHKAGQNNRKSSIMEEINKVAMKFAQLGPEKLIAVVCGNHDDWTNAFSGVDILSMICNWHGIHYAADEARLSVTVGEQQWEIMARHEYRYNSNQNPTHSHLKYLEREHEPFDIGVMGHTHAPGMSLYPWQGKMRTLIRTGAYQRTSKYARYKGYTTSEQWANEHIYSPVVVLSPKSAIPMIYPSGKAYREFHN